jgi:DNA-binding LytR/AlgR family response regulator
MRTIIADDEPLAVRRLQQELEKFGLTEIVGVAYDGKTAIEMIKRESPDLIIVDIAMPTLTGVEVVDALPARDPPAVIFVSAHEEFALEAFRQGAVDYLLKPLDGSRLRHAVKRAAEARATRSAIQRIEDLKRVIEALQSSQDRKKSDEGCIWVPRRGGVQRVDLADITHFVADGDYVVVHAGEREHLISDSLTALEARLDSERFVRVHRQSMVRIDAVRAIGKTPSGGHRLTLLTGAQVSVGRKFRSALRKIADRSEKFSTNF